MTPHFLLNATATFLSPSLRGFTPAFPGMTPFSLVDELDGEGEGAGDGVLAAEEPRLDSNSEPLMIHDCYFPNY